MKFSLATIAYVFALLAAGMAAFGPMGLFVVAGTVFFWVTMHRNPSSAFFWWLIGGMTICAAMLLLLPVMGSARAPTLRNSCLNNLKQIGLALNNYESVHGAYPPAYLADANGKPMHSWRVLILPYMEHQALYKAYKFDEPWDGPNNRKLWNRMPDVYACPGAQWARRLGVLSGGAAGAQTSDYVAAVDRSTIWNVERPPSYSAIPDGASNTILVVEHSGGNLPWTAPVDLSMDEAIDESTSDHSHGHVHISESYFALNIHPNFGRFALFADAHGKWLPSKIDREQASGLLTIAGGEPVDIETIDGFERAPAEVTVVRYERVYAALTFVALAVLPGFFLARKRRAAKDAATA